MDRRWNTFHKIGFYYLVAITFNLLGITHIPLWMFFVPILIIGVFFVLLDCLMSIGDTTLIEKYNQEEIEKYKEREDVNATDTKSFISEEFEQ
jgi:uncharacterized membrane protein YhaH (DUF805 family)